MIIRDLEPGDIEALSRFILEIYNEYPTAMWFESEPSKQDIKRLFEYKLKGMAERRVTDVVAVSEGVIAGECEIAEIKNKIGYIGIILKKEFRGKGIATLLMDKSYDKARLMGVEKIHAEVVEDNARAVGLFKKNKYNLKGTEGKKVVISGKEHSLLIFEKDL